MKHSLYFNQSAINNRFLFEIHTLEQLRETSTHDPETAHSNNFFEIVWITNGTGLHCIDLEKTLIAPGMVFFVKPGQTHRLVTPENTTGYIISFAEAFLDPEDLQAGATCHKSLYQFFASRGGTLIADETQPDLLDVLQKMLKEFGRAELFGYELLKRYFKIFMIYLSRQFEGTLNTSSQSRNMELVQQFMALLDKNYRAQKMVAAYAGEMRVTPNYLNEIIKKVTGLPAGHHIRNRIVLEAKRLALYSDGCMKEIAYELGFNDSAHFSKFFKSVTGENFSEFKKVKLTFSIAV